MLNSVVDCSFVFVSFSQGCVQHTTRSAVRLMFVCFVFPLCCQQEIHLDCSSVIRVIYYYYNNYDNIFKRKVAHQNSQFPHQHSQIDHPIYYRYILWPNLVVTRCTPNGTQMRINKFLTYLGVRLPGYNWGCPIEWQRPFQLWYACITYWSL